MSAVVGFVALGVIVLAGLLLLTSYYLYRGVFCYPSAKQSDPEQIPDSKAYGTRREEMRRVMEQMKETDWETVYLTAAAGYSGDCGLRIREHRCFSFFTGITEPLCGTDTAASAFAGTETTICSWWTSGRMVRAGGKPSPSAFWRGKTAGCGRNMRRSGQAGRSPSFCPAFPWERRPY